MANAQFTLANSNEKPIIYITEDPSRNVLYLTLAINTSTSLTLRGGKPVPEPENTSAGPAALYLSFGSVLKREEFENLHIEAEGWAAAFFTEDVVNWALSPAVDIQAGPGFTVTFTISNILSAGPPSPGRLSIDYLNLGPVPDDSDEKQVFLINVPSGPVDLHLGNGWAKGNIVYTSDATSGPVSSSLTFYLANPSPNVPLVTQPWGPNAPVFFVSFVYGKQPGFGALTTTELAANIEFGIAEESVDLWTVTPSMQQNENWQLRPQSQEVLGTGNAASVEFSIGSIVTYLQPYLTQMYIQYANLPGYNDGYFALEISKVAPLQITSLSVTPSKFVLNGSTVNAEWTTVNADSLILTYASESFKVTNQLSQPLSITRPGYVILTAYGENSQVVTAQTSINPVYTQSTLAIPNGLASLAASPLGDLVVGLPYNGSPFTIRILRTPENAWMQQTIQFQGSHSLTAVFSADGQHLFVVSDQSFAIFETGNFTQIAATSAPPESSPIACILSPDQTRLYVLSGSSVAISDASTLNTLGTIQVPVGAINLAISADGSTLYVFSQENSLSRINLSAQTVFIQKFLAVPGLAFDQTLGILCLVSLKEYDDWEVLFVDAASFEILGAAVLAPMLNYTVVSLMADSVRGYCYAVLTSNSSQVHTGKIAVIHTASQQLVAWLPLTGYAGMAALSGDGMHLFGQETGPTSNRLMHIDFNWIDETAKPPR